METLSSTTHSRRTSGDGANGDRQALSTSPGAAVPTATESSRPADWAGIGVGGFATVLAVLALVFATVGLVLGRDSDDDGAAATAATVDLTEFALTPATVSVPAGGSLEVTNSGTTQHDLAVTGTAVATSGLDAGDSETLDLSGLEPGDYEISCTIPGHADAGMTGSLKITEGAAGGTSGAGASDGSGAAGAGHDHGAMTEAEAAEMSEAMNETIAQFPAETDGVGNQILEPEVRAGGIKHFELTAEVTPWEVAPGQVVDAWTYNGTVPGPQIHVDVGDQVEITLHNELPMGTDLHLHGINVPNDMDGVAPATQDLIQPGDSFTYRFTADEPAVAMFHAHHHAQLQVPNGMLGTLFVGDMSLPAGQMIGGEAVPADLRIAQELPMVLNDSGVIGYSLNGKSFPATAPITAQRGDWILVHYFNEGSQIHPMHLHQFDQIVIAKDGFPLDSPYVADTLNVAPGERYTVLIQLDAPGTWVWHCHILNHVERDTGMYGMVTAIVVQ